MQQNSKCCHKSGLSNMCPPHKEACVPGLAWNLFAHSLKGSNLESNWITREICNFWGRFHRSRACS